jgi:hypothetical protein
MGPAGVPRIRVPAGACCQVAYVWPTTLRCVLLLLLRQVVCSLWFLAAVSALKRAVSEAPLTTPALVYVPVSAVLVRAGMPAQACPAASRMCTVLRHSSTCAASVPHESRELSRTQQEQLTRTAMSDVHSKAPAQTYDPTHTKLFAACPAGHGSSLSLVAAGKVQDQLLPEASHPLGVAAQVCAGPGCAAHHKRLPAVSVPPPQSCSLVSNAGIPDSHDWGCGAPSSPVCGSGPAIPHAAGLGAVASFSLGAGVQLQRWVVLMVTHRSRPCMCWENRCMAITRGPCSHAAVQSALDW